jgi:predicted nucleic acid-binding Zn ribbon protein
MADGQLPGGGTGEQSEASSVYLRFRELFGGVPSRSRRARPAKDQDGGASVPFGVGRDPRGLGNIVDALTTELGWSSPLAQSELMEGWVDLAGEETAKHSAPVGISEGVLTVSCESTAWATQLRIMRTELMTRIAVRFPDAGIQSIRFQGPEAPSWKRGPRSIPGRGPRDTYG